MSVRRCLALFFFLAVIARAVNAPARLRRHIAGLLAAACRRVGVDVAATVPVVGRDEFTALEKKLNKLSQELERDRLVTSLAELGARSVETTRESRAPATDELTGLSNRRSFDDALAGEIDRARRSDSDIGLVLIDLDDFKQVNDAYGHPQGDAVLREVARVLRDALREVDRAARYGGDELAVILPGTDLEGGTLLARPPPGWAPGPAYYIRPRRTHLRADRTAAHTAPRRRGHSARNSNLRGRFCARCKGRRPRARCGRLQGAVRAQASLTNEAGRASAPRHSHRDRASRQAWTHLYRKSC